MKTTLELPDDLMRAIKLRAVKQNLKLKDAIADLLRKGLARDRKPTSVRKRVEFPLVLCAREAHPADEITPERAAEILLAGDGRDAR
ncbi:MAG TPA: antitoxin [Vicinamibacteria bacterium]|nr:antitoxin [Vicinamibacteria bacterium]